jgi:hypothetical protein
LAYLKAAQQDAPPSYFHHKEGINASGVNLARRVEEYYGWSV